MSVCVIAEAGVNHNGSMRLARQLIAAAARAGADAVKFQSFRVDRLVVRGTQKAAYQARTTGRHETQDQMLRRLALSMDAQRRLREVTAAAGLEFLSSPFDEESLADLVRLRVSRLKIASGEMTNALLLLAAARSGRPLLLSTGMCDLADVERALAVVAWGLSHRHGWPTPTALAQALTPARAWERLRARVTLLHCTTEYPTAWEDVNLRAMDTLAVAFGLPVGYSDHTPGHAVALAAVARGAVVIEKHFTLDRTLPGPDHQASIEPEDLAALVTGVRQIEASLGSGRKVCAPGEAHNRAVARKSLVAARTIDAGDVLMPGMLTAKRPGTGVSPMDVFEWRGRPAPRRMAPDDAL